jgi:hypothetical protein
MATQNPYATPRTNVARDDDAQYGEVRMFSSSGRIGRVRYIAYTIGFSLLGALLIGVAGARRLSSTRGRPSSSACSATSRSS